VDAVISIFPVVVFINARITILVNIGVIEVMLNKSKVPTTAANCDEALVCRTEYCSSCDRGCPVLREILKRARTGIYGRIFRSHEWDRISCCSFVGKFPLKRVEQIGAAPKTANQDDELFPCENTNCPRRCAAKHTLILALHLTPNSLALRSISSLH